MRILATQQRVSFVFLGILLYGLASTLAWPQSFSPAFFEEVTQSWYELSPQERSRALENYQRFKKLSPERQRIIEERYQRWQQLPPEEKERIRRNYERYREMNSDEKEDFQRKYKKWRSQSPR
jgi:ATPase subunit of ABC transporter with duplicated ATPase domains